MEVFIDGIRYVPAKTVRPSDSRAIKIALLQEYWGDCSNDTDAELDEKWKDVYIVVTDRTQGYTPSDLLTINDVLDEISRHQNSAPVTPEL